VNLILRALKVLLMALWRPRLGFWETSRIALRCWPNDLDPYLHMNNGRYLTVMDLGRSDWFLRSGMIRLCLKRRWRPVVGSAAVRFLRPLPPLARFELHTRVLGWEHGALIIEQHFRRGGHLLAKAVVKIVITSRHQRVEPAELAAVLKAGEAPPLPAEVQDWLKWDHAAGQGHAPGH